MKVIIVDEDDNPIGLAERDQWADDAIHRISALWLTNSKGEVLIARRSLKKRHGAGMWGPAAAGTVEDGETYEENIIKEAEEELGIKISADHLTRSSKFLMGTPGNRRFAQWFTAIMDIPHEDLLLQEEEVAEARWVQSEDLRKWIAEKPDEFTASLSPVLREFLGES